MKIYHNTQIIDGKECIMLYVDYPADYEFSLDFNKLKQNALEVSNKIRDYAVKNFKNLTNDTTILILNGVALGTLLTAALINKFNIKYPEKSTVPSIEAVQTIDETDNIAPVNVEQEGTQEEASEENSDDNKTDEESEENTEETEAPVVSDNNTTVASNTTTNNTSKSSESSNKPSTSTPNNNINTGNTNNTTTKNEKMINLKLNSGNVISISLEDYVTGVVSAEMPAAFNTEALKAQAVAARTYALKRLSYGATLTATTSNQVYKTESELRSMWGNSYNAYYDKVKNAVYSTKGQYLTYNGKYIDALYFSTSNGRTENAENVWSTAYPYLVSVESPWDVGIPSYSGSKSIPMSTIAEKLNVPLTSSSQIKILERTVGNRVKTISICDKKYTGVEIRTIFGLKSADFDISTSGNNIVFTTRGYGHGVGMSQYGANLMAKAGYSYRDILKHYYTGVAING